MVSPAADPDEFAAKLRYWRERGRAPGRIHPGRDNVTPVLHEHTGERVGYQREHWSGRVDATAERVEMVPIPGYAEQAERGRDGS